MSAVISGSPIFVAGSANFVSLLQGAIECEEEHDEDEYLPVSDANFKLSATTAKDQIHAVTESPAPSTQSRQHKRRREARNKNILIYGYPNAAGKYLKNARVVKSDLETAHLPVAAGAHTAKEKPRPRNPDEIPEIKKLIEEGYTYIACGDPKELPRPIVDRDGRIVALIAGAPPRDTVYDKHAHDLFKIIIEESDSKTFKRNELVHKRGDFPAINFGYTLPNGFNNPINLDARHHKEKIYRLSSSSGFTRISAFQNASFAFWNPGVYEYQKSRIEQLLAHNPELKRTTEKTIFPTTACNFRNRWGTLTTHKGGI
ncbi:hypothetical protein BJ912DRAFT_931962 [Pholiota molesta]|nr:hypothetical protein BJ912DRAFT_931962 [Pholiota molesta]